MNMSWLESIVYGLISGISEFLPISSKAHQELAMLLFGVSQYDPVRNFVVHIALIFALYYACTPMFQQVQGGRKSHNQYVSRQMIDKRLIKGATLPMVIGLIVLWYTVRGINGNLLICSGMLLINGVLLFVPGRMLQGNKDARSMSQLDSILLGFIGGLGSITGISRLGCQTGLAITRGADRQQALNWALNLSMPALVVFAFMDVLQMFTVDSIPFWSSFFTYILSAAGSFTGGYCAIKLVRLVMVRVGFSGFAYYSWGAALLTFLLYLFAV
ncbi:MAG: undecaprenyl-diphosphate phosphatase [Oscillospiraceae bacterium]|nr:undecaprenyl-diphosphate phosphatase [Oscillospiraceae bacterium]